MDGLLGDGFGPGCWSSTRLEGRDVMGDMRRGMCMRMRVRMGWAVVLRRVEYCPLYRLVPAILLICIVDTILVDFAFVFLLINRFRGSTGGTKFVEMGNKGRGGRPRRVWLGSGRR
jgi:hypothetical protein